MKKKILSISIIALVMSSSALANVNIYVAPDGKDTNSGQIESPLRTLHGAQQKVRAMVKANPEQETTVYLRGGRYEMSNTLHLSFEDAGAKLTFAAYDNEQPCLSAGRLVEGWSQCTDYPEGTPTATQGKLWVAKIPDGIDDFKVLFDGNKRLARAKSAQYTMPVNESVPRSDSQNVEFNRDRIYLRMLPFVDQIRDWENLSDIEAFFNPVPWCLNFIPLESVDMEQKVAYLQYEANSMPFTNKLHSMAFIENAIDYLDEPGEWCVNTHTRKIYYWPTEEKPSNEIYVPALREMIRVEGRIQYDLQQDVPVKNIHFENIHFTHADRSSWYKDRKGWGIQHDWDTFDYDNAILRFRGAEDCSVRGCEFSNSGGSAIRLDLHAQNIVIEHNYIAHVGHMGVLLAGYGPGTKDVNKRNIIRDNIIHHCGEVIWHGHGIFAWQSGENLIAHNYIHDVPRKAIGLCGVRCQILLKEDNNFDEASKTIRWHEILSTIDKDNPKIIERYAPYLHARNNIVEHNHVERTMLLLSDGSSINISGAGLGNIVRHNYLYDIPYVGIRTDDWQDGTLIENNLLNKIGKIGVTYKGINTLKNNIFIECAKAMHFRSYPKQYFESEGTYIQHNVIYSTDPKFAPNTLFKWGKMEVWNKGTNPMPYDYEMDYNAYYWANAEADLALKRKNGIEANGVVMDPKFADLEKRDYRIKNKALIKAIDFQPFDTKLSSYGITKSYPAKFVKKDPTLNRK